MSAVIDFLATCFDRVLSWVLLHRLFGPRCEEFHPDCIVCQRWREHDELFNPETEDYPHEHV